MGARKNIVELINEEFFIKLGNLLLDILASQHCEHFGSSEFVFQNSVETLQITLCCKGAAVHFEIKLAVPNLKILVIL